MIPPFVVTTFIISSTSKRNPLNTQFPMYQYIYERVLFSNLADGGDDGGGGGGGGGGKKIIWAYIGLVMNR